jgi:hypothetical protein
MDKNGNLTSVDTYDSDFEIEEIEKQTDEHFKIMKELMNEGTVFAAIYPMSDNSSRFELYTETGDLDPINGTVKFYKIENVLNYTDIIDNLTVICNTTPLSRIDTAIKLGLYNNHPVLYEKTVLDNSILDSQVTLRFLKSLPNATIEECKTSDDLISLILRLS